MAVNNRKCVICGRDYYYCNTGCASSLHEPSWKASFCCENCRNIYNACVMYSSRQMSKEEAKSILDECDLSNKESFTSSTKRIIAEIYLVENVEVSEVKENNSSDKAVENNEATENNIKADSEEVKEKAVNNDQKNGNYKNSNNYKKYNDKFKKINR